MLVRFCLYGFLKNQRYFEPFLILVFLEKGLSFFDVGTLIAFREVAVNLFELPSGAAADLYGRRRAMILAFVSYLGAFAVFALSSRIWMLFVAMAFFALGEALRSGTHKAMILDWLELTGRTAERTEVYGTTRSWSQIGSAVSVVIAASIVLVEGSYTHVFGYSMVPYTLGLINFLGYPAVLDGPRRHEVSWRRLWRHLVEALRDCWQRRPLRGLLLESTLWSGTHKAVKDYLQPVLQQSAVLLPLLVGLQDVQRSAILVGLVYFALHLLSAAASRQAYRARDAAGGVEPATARIWSVTAITYAALAGALITPWAALAIAPFVLLAVLQNLWMPIYLERIDAAAERRAGATVLSVDAQARSLYVMLLAPAVGWAVDHAAASAGPPGLWPVAVVGLVASAVALGTRGIPRATTGQE